MNGGTWWRSPGWPIPAWIHTNAPYLTHTGMKVSEMLAPNVPPMECRSPGPGTMPWPKGGLAGLGIISTTVPNGGAGGTVSPDYFYGPAGPVIGEPGPLPNPNGGGAAVFSPAPPPPTPSKGQTLVNPVWTDTNNNVITSAVCGSIYSMTFPGYEGKTLYLIQTKNGAQNFAGQMSIPLQNYASKCNQDEGAYQVSGYDPMSGNLIGQGSFTVLPAGTASTVPSSTGTTGATTPAAAPGTVPTAPAPAQAVGMTPATPTAAAPATTSAFANITGVDWILIAAVIVALLQKK